MSYPVQYAMPPRSYSYPQAPPGFPQLPFNGPPPKPPHIPVNHKDWQNGTWSINPAFNASQWSLSSSASTNSWVPGQAWHQQRQQEWMVQQQQMAAAAAYNPYKRVPRPPSAQYLASKLSDNPLGLTDMIPREQLFGPSQDGLAAPTPWVWNPRGLSPDETEEGSSTNAQGPEPPPAAEPIPPLSAPPHGVPPPLYARQSQSREMTDPTPQSRPQTTVPVRHSSEPPAERRSSTDTLPTLDRPLDRPRQYQRNFQRENFTSTRELQPTFSAANIVRTPDHYRVRSASAGPSPPPQPIYGPPVVPRRLSVDSHLANRMEALSTQPNEPSRHSSMPALLGVPSASMSMTDVTSLVDEPSSLLSPLVIPSTHKHVSRPLGPSSSLSAIPEGFDSTSTRRSPNRKPHRRSRHTSPVPSGSTLTPPHTNLFGSNVNVFGSNVTPPRASEYGNNLTPPHVNLLGSSVTPPHPNPHHPMAVSPSHAHTHPRQGPNVTPPRAPSHAQIPMPPHPPPGPPAALSPSHGNPLPDPPRDPPRNPEFRLPIQRTPPATYRVAVRKGFWNRRGDHLTVDGYIVYAPADCEYPVELSDYPAETVGYRDSMGGEIPYLEMRPELPESLPRHGRPPLQPYEKFVVYDYLQ